MIFCEKCGNRLNEGAVFCVKCGAATGGRGGNMSASTLCTRCGTQLVEGEIFCSKCGARVDAASQHNPAPNQAQPLDVGGEVLKEIELSYIIASLKWENGTLLLYKDKLGWKGDSIFVIPIEEISSVKYYGTAFRIILNNGKEYNFGHVSVFNQAKKKKEMKSFCDEINNLRFNVFNKK